MTSGTASVIDQAELHRLYATVPTVTEYERMCALEDRWIGALAEQFKTQAPPMADLPEFLCRLDDHLREQATTPSIEHSYLAGEASLDEFRVVAAEFAPDGLTESLNLMPIVSRLSVDAAMPIMRILIDEMGCGNPVRAHARLYAGLLDELDMSVDVADYTDEVTAESLAYVNMFHWLAGRAPSVEYFLGGYGFFESSVLYGFRSYAACARRLGLAGAEYFTEHLYIDKFHAGEMLRAMRGIERMRRLDTTMLWAGMMITSTIVNDAALAAIDRARRGERIGSNVGGRV